MFYESLVTEANCKIHCAAQISSFLLDVGWMMGLAALLLFVCIIYMNFKNYIDPEFKFKYIEKIDFLFKVFLYFSLGIILYCLYLFGTVG